MDYINITLMKKNVCIAEKELTAMAVFKRRHVNMFMAAAAESVFTAVR